MPYHGIISRDEIELLDLLDDIPYKYVKQFQEKYENDDTIDIEIEDLSHNYSTQWSKTQFTFELENIPQDKYDLSMGTTIYKVIKEYHNCSASGYNMRNLYYETESESESEKDSESEEEKDIQ